MNKIIAFGVRNYEIPFFEKYADKYNVGITCKSELLNNGNISTAFGYEAVLIRSNCNINYDGLKILKDNGLKYLLSRTAGINHIDIDSCRKLGIYVANTPYYSPNAVSELALSLALTMVRNIIPTANATAKGDYRVQDYNFCKEIRNMTVGIIGVGRIGGVTAKLFNGLGTKILGYSAHRRDCEYVSSYVPLKELAKNSDIVICHCAYKKGENDKIISKEFIDNMKDGGYIINVARGELLDTLYAVESVKNGKLSGLALDVAENEKDFFGKEISLENCNPLLKEIAGLYPKIILTPHIASATDKALEDTIEISLQNYIELKEKGSCENQL